MQHGKNYSHTNSSKAEACNMVKDHSLKQSGSTCLSCLNSPIDIHRELPWKLTGESSFSRQQKHFTYSLPAMNC